MKFKIFCDGGARGNPGNAGIGISIKYEVLSLPAGKAGTKKEEKVSKYIGTATNNQAEYRAVIEALNWLIAYRQSLIANGKEAEEEIEAEFFLDSQLVVEQLNQRYKLKNEGLKPLFWQIRKLMMKLGSRITFVYIPREQNKEADRLVNEAIDKEGKRKL